MGIQGLLPVLKPITNTVHVSKYRGHKVAVDAYCWLHKAAYCCAEEICEGRFTDRHVVYCMQKVQMLQQCGVHPIIVFDGGKLPMKAAEEGTRSRARQENKNKAAAHVKAGNKQAAHECYQRAVDISPATAHDFIRALKAANVDFIVAPFEADAQMAYLAVNGIVHSVITEDSDLLPYGCPRVLFKMDKAGEGQEVVAADLAQNRDPSFIGFTHQMFLEMCIFAGCDFLKALPGIGMKKAHQHMKRLKTHRKVCKSLRFSGVSVPRDYEQGFQRALWTFQHQRVWSPDLGQLVPLRPLPAGGLSAVDAVAGALAEGDCDFDFLGPVQPDSIMQQVAEGDLNPITLKPFPVPVLQIPSSLTPQMTPTPNANPLEGSNSLKKSWQPQRRSSEGKMSGGKRPLTLPVQANGITSYFPTLPTKAEALRQFSAPRPATRPNRSSTPPQTRFSAANPIHAAEHDDLQLSSSGRFSISTSPAGKASCHLSGCGSQPELPHHAFASFAAGTQGKTQPSSRLARRRQASPLLDQASGCLSSTRQPSPVEEHREPAFSPADRAAASHSCDLPSHRQQALQYSRSSSKHSETSHSIDGLLSRHGSLGSEAGPEAAAADMRISDGSAADAYPAGLDNNSSLLLEGNGSHPGSLRLPSAQKASPFKTASTGCSQPSALQPPKRKVSTFFGGQPKRHKSVEAEELPPHASPYGLLGGLVSKLKPQQSLDGHDSSADDGIDVDLDFAAVTNLDRVEQEDVLVEASDACADAEQEGVAKLLRSTPVVGLEHVQPFASIANVAVNKVKAASLKKFGMAEADKSATRARNMLHPFAPPRRCNASQGVQQQTNDGPQGSKHIAPALQKFACLVGSDERC